MAGDKFHSERANRDSAAICRICREGPGGTVEDPVRRDSLRLGGPTRGEIRAGPDRIAVSCPLRMQSTPFRGGHSPRDSLRAK